MLKLRHSSSGYVHARLVFRCEWNKPMSDLTFLPAVRMAEQIRRKELSPVELVEAHLRRISELNPKLNAYVHLNENAHRQAEMAEATVQRNESLGPLHGVPLSIKGCIDVAGLRNETGTKLRAGNVASQDAPLVARLRAAGAIILGVTNTPEFLMAWETDNLLYGRTNNPWDLSRTAGRIQRRRSRSHRFRLLGGRRRKRRRRFHSRPCALHRHLRTQTHSGPHSNHRPFSAQRRPVHPPGRRRAHGAHGGRSQAAL